MRGLIMILVLSTAAAVPAADDGRRYVDACRRFVHHTLRRRDRLRPVATLMPQNYATIQSRDREGVVGSETARHTQQPLPHARGSDRCRYFEAVH